LFEKAEIKWVCVDDIKKMQPKFRSYFQNIVDMIYAQKNEIKMFISKNLKKSTKKKTLKRHSKRRAKTLKI
jgi:transcription termination factor NusB